jgi:hypothetical protein
LTILVLVLEVDYRGAPGMHLLVVGVELQIRDDVADVQKQTTVFKKERHPGA